MRTRWLMGLGVLVCLHSGLAFGQSDMERAAARNAANAGRDAYENGRYEEAIESLTRAEKILHAPTHLLYMARSQAKLGKLVAARENYLKITHEVLPSNASKAFVEAQSAAQTERQALETRLPWVTITVQGPGASEATVKVDGEVLPASMIGVRLPIDPGEHQLQAVAASAQSAPTKLVLAEGANENVVLTAVASAGKPSAPGATPGPLGVSTSGTPGTPITHDTSNSRRSALPAMAYASFGLGAVGLGLGTFFLAKSGSTRNDADQLYNSCSPKDPSAKCSDPPTITAIESKDRTADKQRNLGVASLIVGGVGVASGITFLIVDSKRGRAVARRASFHALPMVGFGSVGVVGSF